MPKASAGEVIIRNFNNVFRLQGLPFRRTFCRPSARAAWGISRKTPISCYGLELIGKGRLILCFNRGRISHVVKQAVVIVQSEQYRSDDLSTT